MNCREKLLELFNKACLLKYPDFKFDNKIKQSVEIIAKKAISQKAVYTVLITLAIYKLINPAQDIRYHQSHMPNGFSGRTIDTKFITPTLKEFGLPSMNESGWLTRSLEQPFPFTLDFQGKIRDIKVKQAFLFLVDIIQNNPQVAEDIVLYLLYLLVKEKKKNKIEIIKLSNPDKLQISEIIDMLSKHFFCNYHDSNGAKLPVIAFYAIYQSLIADIKRYQNCKLKELGFHTTCDATSKSSGDIEIYSNKGILQESLEIKFEREVDCNIVRVAKEKIIKYNPIRYYILSTMQIKDEDKEIINKIIEKLRDEHGCQLIINGVMSSLRYYLRLISSLDGFISAYSQLIEQDTELKPVHKEKWNEIIKQYNSL